VLSALLVSGKRFLGPWLEQALTEQGVWAVAWAVGGHHLQLQSQTELDRENPLLRIGGSDKTVTLYLNRPEIPSLLSFVREFLEQEGIPTNQPPTLPEQTFTTEENCTNSIEPLLRTLLKDSREAWTLWKTDRLFAQRLAVLKALLIAADVAGSALAAEGLSIPEWISRALAVRLEAADLTPIVESRLKGQEPRNFQAHVAESTTPVTVVVAGCGNGKTIAAYLWAKRWAAGRKLFFAYPTTGTTSAGFEDYLLAQNHLERALIHGKSQVDLQAMVGSPEDDPFESASRLDSLKAWGQQVVACTIDTVLGLIQNQRRGLFSTPAIACAAFVFDEIHNYDRRLFGELLTFLRMFPGAPVLLMSASIPPTRLAALHQTLGDRMGAIIPGDPILENRPRYRLENRSAVDACWPEVLSTLEQKGKVLWVCNTVNDAVKIAQHELVKSTRPLIYHSRFRYRDRVERQREVLAAFSPTSVPRLVVTTQVCEMSLDISADLLVTALAPLPALVQRLGRLNRFAEEGSPERICLVYPFSGKPYEKPEHIQQIDAAKRTISALAHAPCSQAELASHLSSMWIDEQWTETSAWLDGGWQSKPLPPREGEYTVTMIREEDLEEIAHELGPEKSGRWTAQKLVPWTIPMPLNESYSFVRRIGGYPVAPLGAITYDLTEGARWRKRNK
jgi:CRISPR-associated endonuclease/helicase Cas3